MAVLTLNSLPLGYRFRPTDEELVDYYLRNKINGNDNDVQVIREIDVCKWEPWDLPELSVVQSKDLEWFFFCPRDQKYPSGPRLNRATGAGYWKATGKDRRIKNRANEIGMKKTLVFYKGRAPKGKRTNWVMHEYRPTLAELDGTHPGQNAFVLCRLFKKLDETVESSLCDEVEPALSSPTSTNFSPGYTESELALEQEDPALGSRVEKQPTNSEKCQAEDFERSSANILVPLECHNHNNNADDANDHAAAAATEVDPPQVEYGDWMSDSIVDPEDYKLFSPLSAQMRAELGSSDMHYLSPNNFSNGHSGLQFQYGTNEQDISEFLNSILNDSEDDYHYEDLDIQKSLTAENETPKYINTIYKDSDKDSGSCNGSDPESAQAQLDMKFERMEPQGCFLPLVAQSGSFSVNEISSYGSAGDSGTGIRIRNRQPEHYSTSTNFVIHQGIAHRRVRMQTKLEIGTHQLFKTDFDFGANDDKEKSTLTEEEKPAENHHAVEQGSATTVYEPQKLTLSEPVHEVPVRSKAKLRSKRIVLQYSDNDSPVFAKTGVRSAIMQPMSMLRKMGVVIVFCVVLAGLWRSIEYY